MWKLALFCGVPNFTLEIRKEIFENLLVLNPQGYSCHLRHVGSSSEPLLKMMARRPGDSVESVSDSWPGACEFDPRLRRTFFQAYFRLSPLQKHMKKVVGVFGKKSCAGTCVRKPKNTSVTDRHYMTLAVKVASNPNTTNQPKWWPLYANWPIVIRVTDITWR